MHSRLLPLNPPSVAFATSLPRFVFPRLSLPSMPWLEIAFFSVMIFGLISSGA
jgi:hypothetical protein